MSHQKKSTFNQLLDYFNEEDEEEEFINFEPKNNNYIIPKPNPQLYTNTRTENNNIVNYTINTNINANTNMIQNSEINNNSINDKEKQIFTELYSNVDSNDDNVFYCEERCLPLNDVKGEECNNLKVVSFRPNKFSENDFNINSENIQENENGNIAQNNNIIEKIKTNNWLINSNNNEENNEKNDKQSQKEMIYNKIIANQCSFGNINETSNRSTSINTDKLGEYSQSKLFQENFDQDIYKPEYLINSQCFDELENKNMIENNNNNNEQKCNNIDTNTYTFKQNEKINININKKESNKNNININELKNNILKNTKEKSKSKSKQNNKKIQKKNNINNNININKNINNSNHNKKPIELVLYDDAVKKKQKMENIYKNNMAKIQLNSTKNKINKKSYQIALEHDDKKIEHVINKYSNNKNNKKEELTIVDIAQIFQELKIFRKLLENINVNKLSNINNIKDFKNKISIAIKEGDIRKNEELDFLEKTWNILNSEQKSYIRKDIFEGLIKILFASTGNVNDIINIVKQYLQAALFGEGIIELSDRNRKDDGLGLRNYIKKFFKLKENIIAYQNINNYNSKKFEKIIKERNSNLTFEPNIPQNENFHTTITQRRKNFNFNALYDRFIQKEKSKQTNLNQLKRNKIKEELKELKQKPTINKPIDNSFYSDTNCPQNIHDKLYLMDKHIRQKKQERIDKKIKEDNEKFENEYKSFRLNINSKENRKRMAKSFDNKIKPKGYDDYITRNKKAILERKRIKNIIEKIPCGENYEKIKRRSITPFNITDMRKRYKNKQNNNNKKDEFFTLQIKIPNGQLRVIKIYMKSDPYKVADDFCKIYSIKDSVKRKLINNIISCQKAYINNKKQEEMENEREELEEEGEYIDNENEIVGNFI